jgi:hypothetical protein
MLLFAWPAAQLMAQSQPSQQQAPPPQTQPQAQTPTQASTDDKPDSVAEAARKAKEKKAATAKGKVLTEDDLAGKKGGVSVVGNEGRKPRRAVPTANPNGDYEPNGEDYWRGRSQPILDEIAATDQQIAQLKDDIKKYGNGGFDVQTGMKDSIAYIHDRNAQLDNLQKRKADLQGQLEDLQDEGRKAGAPAAWFR